MSEDQGIRYARKAVDASCLLLFRGSSCVCQVKNISASGILIEPIEDESINEIELNSVCILEIVVNDVFNLHVSSKVTRINDREIALHYISIPEEKQVALWQLLGDHVHEVETYGT
ncbi:PilZ domain-containing protein [Marinicella sp. S1101]|uniref:PilZ domain-containing protein n=1 Tax=Marinicella marina TaxID=2996016 RepID=UPI002260F481|nr:PilZ domain-containing protein [Marinicella marina]MCX7553706.1 PilZ domain-containing protein [Marinicella marina]MDJ1140796.1 PilZ domain-containing protein [Marinicella marina]